MAALRSSDPVLTAEPFDTPQYPGRRSPICRRNQSVDTLKLDTANVQRR